MTKQELQIEYLFEQQVNTNECLVRIMEIVANHTPSLIPQISDLDTRWNQVREAIDKKYAGKLEKVKNGN